MGVLFNQKSVSGSVSWKASAFKASVLMILFLLPISAELSGLLLMIFALVFVWADLWHLRRLKWFLLAALLGASSQVMQWVWFQPQLSADSLGKGLIKPLDLANLTAWNQKFLGHQWARVQQNGMWRLQRRSPDGNVNQEVYLARYLELEAGRTYTQEFEMRSDAPVNFMVSFFTAQGHQPVRPDLIGRNGDRFRFRASLTAQADDVHLRAMDLIGLTGAWSWLELGSVQVARADQNLNAGTSELWQRFLTLRPWFWVGSLLLAAGAMIVMRRFLETVHPRRVGLALLLGMCLQLIVVVYVNAVGAVLSSDKNQLAHGAVMVSAVIAMFAPSGLGLIGVTVAGAIALLLGARGALLGLSIPLVGLVWQLGFLRSRRSLLALTLGLVVGVSMLAWLVRPSQEAFQSGVARFEIWQIAWQAMLDRPLGYGPGQFAQVYAIQRPSEAFDALVAHPHNLLLGLGVEFGWPGLLGVLLIWFWLLRDLFAARAWPVLVVVISAVLLNVFDYTWFTASLALPLWLAVGCQNFVWTRIPD